MAKDRTLVCQECGREFIYPIGLQKYYRKKGYYYAPRLCPECYQESKIKGKKRPYNAVCKKCGKSFWLPFNPVNSNTVLCDECYKRKNISRCSPSSPKINREY